jgi:hypothetical protein
MNRCRQYSRERLGEVPALKRLAQDIIHADSRRSLRELWATVAAHEDDRDVGPNPPDFARELGADEVRHRFVGENEIEALRFGSQRL